MKVGHKVKHRATVEWTHASDDKWGKIQKEPPLVHLKQSKTKTSFLFFKELTYRSKGLKKYETSVSLLGEDDTP